MTVTADRRSPTVRDILHIMPISEFDGLSAFKRLLSSRVIDFPTRKAL